MKRFISIIILTTLFFSCSGNSENENVSLKKTNLQNTDDIIVIVDETPPPPKTVVFDNTTNYDVRLQLEDGTYIASADANSTVQTYGQYHLQTYPDPTNKVMAIKISETSTTRTYKIIKYMEITTNSYGNPVIKWNSTYSSNITSFKIFRAKDNGPYSQVHSTTSFNGSWTDYTKIEGGTFGTYFTSWYKVVEYYTNGSSAIVGEPLYIKTSNDFGNMEF